MYASSRSTNSLVKAAMLSVMIVLCGCSKKASGQEVDAYLQMFVWRKDTHSGDVAASFSKDEIVYQISTDPSNLDVGPQRDQLQHIADVSGVNIRTLAFPGEVLNLYVINRSNIIDFFADDSGKDSMMSYYHLPDFLYENIKKYAVAARSFGSKCSTVSLPASDESTSISVLITNDFRDACELNHLYYAFGVKAGPSGIDNDVALCILYSARRKNMKTKDEISREFKNIEPICRKKWGGSGK